MKISIDDRRWGMGKAMGSVSQGLQEPSSATTNTMMIMVTLLRIKSNQQERECLLPRRISGLLLIVHQFPLHHVLPVTEEEAGGGNLLCSGRKANTFWDLIAGDYPNGTVVMAVEGRNNQKKMCEKKTMWDHLWSIDLNCWKEKRCSWEKNNSKDLRLGKITVWGVMNIE